MANPDISIPVNPVLPAPVAVANRRAFIRGAAGAGLALPVLGGLNPLDAVAQMGAGQHQADSTPVPSTPVPFTVYDPVLPPVEAGPKEFTVVAIDATLFVAKDIAYAGWTFDGTIPGRTLRVVEGDTVTMTIRNDGAINHSLDTHAAKTPANVNYPDLKPGEEFTWSFVASTPGAFMYHCGTPPALMHIGAGMYGAMIVDPKEGWPAAQEFILVQSEFYFGDPDDPIRLPNMAQMMYGAFMDYVVFNGHATQYADEPIRIKVGEPVRIFIVNAGPNVWSSFHVVGAIFDRACVNANPRNELFGLQSMSVGPGDGACVEFTVEEPGMYVAVNHAFGHANHGALARLIAE